MNYVNNRPIITVIMVSILPIITKSTKGNNDLANLYLQNLQNMICETWQNNAKHYMRKLRKLQKLSSTSLGDKGGRVEKPSSAAFVFKYFRQFKEKRRPGAFAILAPRLYNRYNHAHVPGPHMLQSPGPGPCSKCSKTVEVRCSY